MKVRNNSRGWMGFALAGLLALGLAAPAGLLLDLTMPTPASANSELHPGGRLFFPAWDVQGSRLSFLIITRLNMFPSDQDADGKLRRPVLNTAGDTIIGYSYDYRNNCKPQHSTAHPANGTPGFVTGNVPNPVDDVHLEFYGKSCDADNEILKMSCADIDLIFLSAGNLNKHAVLGDQQGSLDVHFVVNGGNYRQRVEENSLLGYGVIADPTQGWVAAYPAAAAKSTVCSTCATLDGGTDVGYEAFPTEVFIPFALADDSQGGLINELYLWAPSFFPGDIMPTTFGIDWFWFDGRERRFTNSRQKHVYIEPLKTLDSLFQWATFVCGDTTDPTKAENDGAPATGTAANLGCGDAGSAGSDANHLSDNGQTLATGYGSTSIGWWDIQKVNDTAGGFPNNPAILATRGMVGVVISRTEDGIANDKIANGDAIRLWHKDPCEIAPKGEVGPPHLRDRAFTSNNLVLFNTNQVPVATRLALCEQGTSLPQ